MERHQFTFSQSTDQFQIKHGERAALLSGVKVCADVVWMEELHLLFFNFTLVVKSIDRLGRNYNEIPEQWRIMTKEKGAAIVVLDMHLLDTQKNRDLTGTLIADIVLQLLSYVAQTEREFIHQRQAEGIAVAKAQGVRLGRPPLAQPKEFPAVHQAWLKKEISAREAAWRLSVTHKNISQTGTETVKSGKESTDFAHPPLAGSIVL